MLEDSTQERVRIKKVNRGSKKSVPCVLTIAGSDSGGGAGIQADLKTFAALGVHGASAITCVTAQNPAEVRTVQSLPPEMVREQIQAAVDGFQPRVVKTGMLYSKTIIDVVHESLAPEIRMIVDPVMISTSGALLLRESAVGAMKRLLKRAFLVTPNLQEAEYLLGRKLGTPEDLRKAAREFHEKFGCAALVKGGHLKGMDVALDFLYDGRCEWVLEAPYVRDVSTHGTGCTYSAAIAACCAKGETLPGAVTKAKHYISNAIAQSYKSGAHFVLNTHWDCG